MNDDEEEIAHFLSCARYDWYVTRSWHRLHWADLTPEDCATVPEHLAVLGPVRLACGRTAAWASIPGPFTRMGAMRCTGCCRATGMPRGKGSPKNDPACRKVLGLD